MKAEVFQGDPHSLEFQQWLERLTRGCKVAMIILADDIPCYKAQETIKKVKNISSQRSLNWHPWLIEETKTAMIHLAICQQQGNCRKLFQSLAQEDSSKKTPPKDS